MEKETIIKQFEKWKEELAKIDEQPVNARDFDCWLSGYVAGFSLQRNLVLEEVRKTLKEVVESESAKKVGVTGTKVEAIKEVEV